MPRLPAKLAAATKKMTAYALSNDDINDILDPPTRILTYPAFAKMSSIDEAFDELGRCIFLFLTESERSGHWCCMWKDGNRLNYFDSYGMPPEGPRKWLPEEHLEMLGEGEPVLLSLLKQSPYKVYYNTVPYQKTDGNVANCGRWCVTRLVFKDLNDKQFYDVVKKSGVAPDDFATLFTAEILGY